MKKKHYFLLQVALHAVQVALLGVVGTHFELKKELQVGPCGTGRVDIDHTSEVHSGLEIDKEEVVVTDSH